MQISIERPRKEDLDEIRSVFQTVVVNTFILNKIPEAYEGEVKDIVARNTKSVENDLHFHGKGEYFLIARLENKIVGIMGIGKPNDEIKKNYHVDLKDIYEIKNAYIMPEFQRKGIGTQLFEKLKEELQMRGQKAFVLDSGFTSAQGYWKSKLGEPVVVVENYWNDGTDYMVWHYQLL